MKQKNIGSVFALYPSLAAVLGTKDETGKVNFMLVAHIGIVSHKLLSISLHNTKTLENIQNTKKVSINLINEKMLERADYCGTVSGKKTDKSGIFEWHEGEDGMPVINDSDLVMECHMEDDIVIDGFNNIICKVENTYVNELMVDGKGKPDWSKIKPVLFEMPSYKYIATGDVLGDCVRMGKAYAGKLKTENE
ncbi:MAG: flavin reductase family protein [Prevotella sp.]|nr:flavin reductase family protein [Prevotella sp.]